MKLCLVSVPYHGGNFYALVPGSPEEAARRLTADDPVWKLGEMWLHWCWPIDPNARVQPANKPIIRFVPAQIA